MKEINVILVISCLFLLFGVVFALDLQNHHHNESSKSSEFLLATSPKESPSDDDDSFSSHSLQKFQHHNSSSSISVSAAASSTLPHLYVPQKNMKNTCEGVSMQFVQHGIASEIEIPKIPINSSLRYCGRLGLAASERPTTSSTCCTEKMELKLEKLSKSNLERNSTNYIQNLYKILQQKSANYSDSFNDLLALSKREFHSMFQRTYGVIYEQNAYVFADLFGELEKYYAKGNVDLLKSMDQFFNKLYQKMFTVLNAQYTFDERYLTCVSEHMKNLKPFGDVPDKLSIQIKRAFVATRTYVSSLKTASSVLKRMTPIRLNSECVAAVTRMQQCSLCNGYTQKPCKNYCINVIKGCFDFFTEFDVEWNNFVSAMDKLAERLLGPFNIVMVVEPINIKISEAIMNFQEAGTSITNKVFQGCGRPKLQKRVRRSVDDMDFYVTAEDTKLLREIREASPRSRFADYDDINDRRNHNLRSKDKNRNNKNNNKKKNDNNNNKYNIPSLEKSIKEIKQKLKETKKFWSTLPDHICNSSVVSASSQESTNGNCWNGSEIGTYIHPISESHSSNPEYDRKISTSRQTNVVATETYILKIAIENLKKAALGQDVTWTETEKATFSDKIPIDDDDFDIMSGDGSGDGSGETVEPISPSTPKYIQSNEKTSSFVPSTERPPTFNPSTDFDDIESSEPTSNHETTKNPKKSGAPKYEEMSLRKALFLYLFPIYMTWFSVIFD